MLDNLDGDYEYIIAEGGLNDFWGHSELGEITDGFSGDFDENTMTGGMEKMIFLKLKMFSKRESRVCYYTRSVYI